MIFLKKKNEISYPKELNNHFEQMVNTIKMLQSSGMVKEFILPEKKRIIEQIRGKREEYYQITWKNDASSVNEKNFLSIEAYNIVVSRRSYQMVLFDNSVIRCSMIFDNEGMLLSQNFSYIPCPLNCFLEKEIGIDEVSDSIDVGLLEADKLLMRTTVRFDYDSSNDTTEHPANHVHMQSPGTRMLTNGPICFNKFIKHIIENFYPNSYYVKKNILEQDHYGQIDELDFIKIKKATSKIQCYNMDAEYKI